MAGVAVEVWTTNGGILFDNFLVSHSNSAAGAFTDATFKLKSAAEGKREKLQEKEEKQKERKSLEEKGGIQDYIAAKVMAATDYLSENSWAVFVAVAAIVIPFLYVLAFGGKTAAASFEHEEGVQVETIDRAHVPEEEEEEVLAEEESKELPDEKEEDKNETKK
jgi:hypothetical protein